MKHEVLALHLQLSAVLIRHKHLCQLNKLCADNDASSLTSFAELLQHKKPILYCVLHKSCKSRS